MKIALLVPGGVDRSGTERVIPCLLWLIERLARDHEVHVFAWDQEPRPGSWPLLGARVHNAGSRPRALRLLSMLASQHDKKPFDVIHAWWANPFGVIGAAASKLLRVPMVLTLPGGDVSRIRSIGYGTRLTARGRVALRVAAGAAASMTVPSQAMRSEALTAGIAASCVPLGVALDRWAMSPPRRRNVRGPIRLLHVGSLNRVKDQKTLLEAAALLHRRGVRFEMDVVGEDTLGGEIQRLAAGLGLAEAVRFRGFLPHRALRPLFDWADLLVVSSLHEGAPIVALEAAVAGVPCVGTAVGHIADFAPDAAAAVPVQDSEALAGAIADLAADEERRLRLAHAAQECALAIDADYTASRFVELYWDAVRSSERTSTSVPLVRQATGKTL